MKTQMDDMEAKLNDMQTKLNDMGTKLNNMDNMETKLNDMDTKINAMGKDLKDLLNSQKQHNGNNNNQIQLINQQFPFPNYMNYIMIYPFIMPVFQPNQNRLNQCEFKSSNEIISKNNEDPKKNP